MERSALARKQKRANDWEALAAQTPDTDTGRRLASGVAELRTVLKDLWESQTPGATDLARLADLERTLEEQAERARLAARPPAVGRGVFDGRMK